MRMALCMEGQFRTAEFCFPSLYENLIKPYSPDIFVCTDSNKDRIQELYHPVDMEIFTQEEINKIIGPRLHRYGDWVPFPEYPQYPICPPDDLSYLFKMKRSRDLMKYYEEKHQKYDVVVSTRFDAKFLYIQPITIPQKDCLYIPRVDACQNESDKNGLHGGVGYGSHLYWCSSEVAGRVLNAYEWVEDAYQKLHRYCGELMLKWFCDNNHIKVIQTDVKFMLIRYRGGQYLDGRYIPLSEDHYPEYLKQEREYVYGTIKKPEPVRLNPLDN